MSLLVLRWQRVASGELLEVASPLTARHFKMSFDTLHAAPRKWRSIDQKRMEARMDRRTFLVGSALGGLAAQPAYAQYFDDAWLKTPPQRPLAPADIESAVEKLRKQF